jgi:hypothetical protein
MLLCSQCDVSDERSNFDRKIEAMFRVYSSKNGSLSEKQETDAGFADVSRAMSVEGAKEVT